MPPGRRRKPRTPGKSGTPKDPLPSKPPRRAKGKKSLPGQSKKRFFKRPLEKRDTLRSPQTIFEKGLKPLADFQNLLIKVLNKERPTREDFNRIEQEASKQEIRFANVMRELDALDISIIPREQLFYLAFKGMILHKAVNFRGVALGIARAGRHNSLPNLRKGLLSSLTRENIAEKYLGNKITFALGFHRLNNVVQEAISTAQELASKKKITLRIGKLHKTQVWLHRDAVKEAVFELIKNAIKFTPSGGVVTVDALIAKNNRFFKISVSDTAGGFKDRSLQTVKEGARITTDSMQGTGSGSSLNRLIVEKVFNGKIKTTRIQKGSRIDLTFPNNRTVTAAFKK